MLLWHLGAENCRKRLRSRMFSTFLVSAITTLSLQFSFIKETLPFINDFLSFLFLLQLWRRFFPSFLYYGFLVDCKELQSSSNFVGKFTKARPTEVTLCGCYGNFDYLRMFTPLFVFPPSSSSMLDSRQWIMHKDSQLKSQHWNRGGEESHTEVKIENRPMIFDDDYRYDFSPLFLAKFTGRRWWTVIYIPLVRFTPKRNALPQLVISVTK